MADYRDIPEQIRAYLSSPARHWTDELADVAETYATLCREANERLRRCSDYLRRGMRSEAVHLAECPPRLVDLAAWLQVPDPAAWEQACAGEGLPVPPRLRLDGLNELKEAYERERSLEPLLARHRVLALGQSPVRERLDLLRAIAERDPENPSWTEGLYALEAARLREVRAEAKAALRMQDRPALESLAAELFGRPWRSDVPEDLRTGMDRALALTRLDASLGDLHAILAELLPAYEARAYEPCAALMTRWQSVVSSGQVALPQYLQDRIRPVANWLVTEERRRAARQRLQAAQAALKADRAGLKGLLGRLPRQYLVAAILAVAALGAAVLAYLYLNHATFR